MSIRIIILSPRGGRTRGLRRFLTRPQTEADFGNSAASLIKAQTANPAASANPSTEPVTGVDPDYAGNVIEAMREDVSKPEQCRSRS